MLMLPSPLPSSQIQDRRRAREIKRTEAERKRKEWEARNPAEAVEARDKREEAKAARLLREEAKVCEILRPFFMVVWEILEMCLGGGVALSFPATIASLCLSFLPTYLPPHPDSHSPGQGGRGRLPGQDWTPHMGGGGGKVRTVVLSGRGHPSMTKGFIRGCLLVPCNRA